MRDGLIDEPQTGFEYIQRFQPTVLDELCEQRRREREKQLREGWEELLWRTLTAERTP